MRLMFVAVLAAASMITEMALAGPLSLEGDSRWIAFGSRKNIDEAISIARAHAKRFPSIRVMRAANGQHVVVAGPENAPDASALKNKLAGSGEALEDLAFSKGEDYLTEVWKPSPIVPLAEARYSGGEPVTLQVGDLKVSVASVPDRTDRSGTDRMPEATVFQGGRAMVRMRLDDVVTEKPRARASVLRLDPSSPRPQVMLTGFGGGTHCCHVTKFAALVGGRWRIVEGDAIDGDEGYRIEDIDGDGTYELTSHDGDFLSAFSSYAASWPPVKVSKLVGARLVDVTGSRRYRSFARQDVHRFERAAGRDPKLWNSNGFLAGWVASKARVGEIDDAWRRMLQQHDRRSDTSSAECDVAEEGDGCPDGEDGGTAFPDALRELLKANGYIPKNHRLAPR
jgi:hypothetical protein